MINGKLYALGLLDDISPSLGPQAGQPSALEWILDRYKECKPRDPTIRAQFNTCRFADYKEQVVDLLMRVCTVSIETMKIIEQMLAE